MNEKEFFMSVCEYIERAEVSGDGEWGSCRTLAELINDGAMPELYAETLRRLSLVD